MQGFNGTVFAYGQTSSGKTFTMMGAGPSSRDLKGIIPRMVETVFNTIRSSLETSEFVLKISYCEIYLEKIKDLIDPKKNNLKIHENKTTGVYIEGLTECGVASEDDVYELMNLGTKNREVAFTNMNAGSSRSHSLFILTVNQTNTKDLSSKKGKLFLVDLAGSEKVGKTGAAGQRLEEAKNINKSLTTLGLVINNLTDGKSSHIPYRDSKLTRILQDSLGGNSKTALIITCSPSPFNEAETVSTLKFGLRAKSIKNKAKVNREFTVAELKLMLARTQEDLEGKNLIIRNLEARLKGELGVELVLPNLSANTADMEEIMSEIQEYKEKIDFFKQNNEKMLLDNKILEGEVKDLENSQVRLENENRELNEKYESLEETLRDQESLIERQIMVKEKLEKTQEELMRKVLNAESESRSKSETISKLKQELDKKDFVPQRAISMSFAVSPVLSPDSEEIDMLYAKVASLSSSLKESHEKESDLVKNYEERLSLKNSEMKKLFENLENLKKEKVSLNNYIQQLEHNHEEAVKNSLLTTEEKIRQNEEYFKAKLLHEKAVWTKEKENILNDLNSRNQKMIQLELVNDRLKQELEKKDFAPSRAISMSFAAKPQVSPDSEEIEMLYERVASLSTCLQENQDKESDLLKAFEEELSLKKSEIVNLIEEIENLKKEKTELNDYIIKLEENHEETVKNSLLSIEEKIRQNDEFFKAKLEHERGLWIKEKEDIMNDLNNRIEKVLQLEMAMDSQKDLINNVQRRMSVQQKETFSNAIDLQNQIQDLNFNLMKEKNAFDEMKINFEFTQKKLTEKKEINKKYKKEIQNLKDQNELLIEKNKLYEETVQPCANFNPRRSVAFNIQKVIMGGNMVNDPRRQSIMIKRSNP
jgi:kinesin family protein 5